MSKHFKINYGFVTYIANSTHLIALTKALSLAVTSASYVRVETWLCEHA